MTSTTIEPMTELDVAAVLAIDLESFHGPPATADDARQRALREQQLREELVRSWARLRVARSKAGEVLGYVLFWHVADEVHLLNVAVAGGARRRGLGKALVAEVIAYARTHRAAKILLEVRASNEAAIGLYEGLGFAPFNVRERYYADGEDGIEMMFAVELDGA